MTGPPIKTFGGDNSGVNSHKCVDTPSACCESSLIPFPREKLIDVSLHHARLAQSSIRAVHHVRRDFIRALPPGFDLPKLPLNVFEIVVHCLEVFSDGCV